MTELAQYIHSYFGIPNADLKKIEGQFRVSTLEKDDYFTRANAYCPTLSFVKSGYLRVFRFANDKEITQWVSSKGEFVTDLSSLVFDAPARWNIQAVTDCELYSISKEEYDKIGHHIPQWERLEKLFLAKCFLTLEDRVFSFLSMTAAERYQHLFTYKQDIFNHVPQHFIASMLGMTLKLSVEFGKSPLLDLDQDNPISFPPYLCYKSITQI